MKPLLFVLALACLTVPAANAQKATYYRWTDAGGVVHYGDTPPPKGAQPVKVATGTPPTTPTPAATSSATGADPALAKAETAARARNCDNARANLKTLDSRALLVDGDDPTTARRMTPEQLASTRDVAERDVATYCAPEGK